VWVRGKSERAIIREARPLFGEFENDIEVIAEFPESVIAALHDYLPAATVVVGRDMRQSSNSSPVVCISR